MIKMNPVIENKIELHPSSVKYIEKTLGQYTEVDYIEVVEDPIVHIYPKKDTVDLQTGDLKGYRDSILSEFHIYEPKNKLMYKTKHLHDELALDFNAKPPRMIRIFKDGSTLVSFIGKFKFSQGTTSLIMYKVD